MFVKENPDRKKKKRKKEISKIISSKNITTNIFRIQENHSIMCGCFCIGFINFILKGNKLLDYIDLFFPKEYQQNDEIMLEFFQ